MKITIRELRANHPDLFYSQDWFEDEAFMDTPLSKARGSALPVGVQYEGIPPDQILWYMTDAPPAVLLVWLYVLNPDAKIWTRYLWTSSEDRHGQRVYVGQNGKGLEIHRHLHITHRFGVPVW